MEKYRQGDILLTPVKKIPPRAKLTGHKLSLSGETGNPHVMEKVDVFGDMQFVKVAETGGALMVHPQHPSMMVPVGAYKVERARTYDPPTEKRRSRFLDNID